MMFFWSVCILSLVVVPTSGHLIIKYADSLQLASTITAGFGNGTRNVINNSTYSLDYSYLARLGLVVLRTNSTCKDLQRVDTDVIFCDESIEIKIDETSKGMLVNDPSVDQQWGLKTVKIQNVWNTGNFGNNVLVCVIDTGVDYTHPDLASNIWKNVFEIPDNGIDDDLDGIIDDINGASFVNGEDVLDKNSHGTLCSGEIAAVQNNNIGISGVAPQSTIIPCRFMDANGFGQIFDAISCINFCLDKNAVIISASWGYTDHISIMDDVMNTLHQKNVIFVASAGNSGSNTDLTIHYPSYYSMNYSNVITVGALGQDSKLLPISNYLLML